jgi:hypothetical protein
MNVSYDSAMAVSELRQTIRDSITPFLQGGWRADEQDHDLYEIHLMDKPSKEQILEVPKVTPPRPPPLPLQA